MDGLTNAINNVGIVPVIVIDDASRALDLAYALAEGGIGCAEITFRTPAAPSAVQSIRDLGDFLVGAGTVLTTSDLDVAADYGAHFVVTPGFDAEVVEKAQDLGLTIIPGIGTASEAQAARKAGLTAVKLFPADQLGGLNMIRALAAPFPDLTFMPSGGVGLGNLAAYLRDPAVLAVSGSWMAPRDLIATGDFDTVRARSIEATTIRENVRAES